MTNKGQMKVDFWVHLLLDMKLPCSYLKKPSVIKENLFKESFEKLGNMINNFKIKIERVC